MSFFDRLKKKKNSKEKGIKNPKILEVNLIKEEAEIVFNWRRNGRSLFYGLGVTIFIIIEIYLGLDWWLKDENARLEVLKNQTKLLNEQVSEIRSEAKDALAYQDKTFEVQNLLDEHIYWSNFFSWLEKNTLNTVTFDGFGGEVDGEYSLRGNAGSYAEVSWQVNRLKQSEAVLEVEVLTAASGEGQDKEDLASEAEANNNEEGQVQVLEPQLPPGVSFEMVLKIDPKIFLK